MLARLLYYMGGVLVRIYTRLMFQMDKVTHTPMPKGAKIIVVNHPTTSDPFIITTITKGQAGILIKDILFDIPIFGRYLKWAGHIPVLPSKGREAYEQALKLLKRRKSVVVFIEGQICSDNEQSCKPHTGAVRLALESKAPIIPVGVGVFRENIKKLKSVVKGKSDIGSWYFYGPYAITIGKSFLIKGNIKNRKQVYTLSEFVMKKINNLAKESFDRIYFNNVSKLSVPN